MRFTRWSSAAVLAAVVSPAIGETDLRVVNGDSISGTLEAGEVEIFRLSLPAGAALSAKAKTARGGAPLSLRLLDSAEAEVSAAAGTKPGIAKLVVAATGEYSLQISAEDGVSASGFSLAIAWKSAKSAGVSADVAAGAVAALAFSADAGTNAAFTVKPAKGSAAVPALVDVAGPHGFAEALGPGASDRRTLPSTGEYTLHFKNEGPSGGTLAASVKLTAPKAAKRKLDVGSQRVPSGATVVAAAVVGKDGGSLTAPEGRLAGASVALAAGAVKKPFTLLLGSTRDLEPPKALSLEAAGPAVFLGPEGAAFPTSAPATVTLPFDPSLFPGGTADLAVFTRDAAGAVTQVTGLTIDGAAGTVSFTTEHFSGFQTMFKAKEATVIARLFRTPAVQLEHFGFAVAGTADWIAAGAPEVAGPAAQRWAGAVFMHPFANGIVGAQQRIDSPSPTMDTGFGGALAMDGSVMVVGMRPDVPTALTPVGAVYVYRLSGNSWQFEQKLSGHAEDGHSWFGYAVAVSGSRIVVGSPSGFEPLSTYAYVFAFDGAQWVEEARLVSSSPVADSYQFGKAVAISGTTVAVGAAQVASRGSVTVFARNAQSGVWSETERFEGNKPTHGFGYSVALDGTVLVCGATDIFDGDLTDGTVRVYEGSPGTMAFVEALSGTGPLNYTFGSSCALSGGRLIIGAEGLGGPAPGKAYAWRRNGQKFQRTATLRGDDVDLPVQSRLGTAVAIAGEYFVAGAWFAPGGPASDAHQGGAAFVFERD